MSQKDRMEEYLTTSILAPAESLLQMAGVEVKAVAVGAFSPKMARGVAPSRVAAGVPVDPSGGIAIPKLVWLAVTSQRLILLRYLHLGEGLEGIAFDAQRDDLIGTLKLGILNQVIVSDASDGSSIFRFNFGIKRAAAKRIILALESY